MRKNKGNDNWDLFQREGNNQDNNEDYVEDVTETIDDYVDLTSNSSDSTNVVSSLGPTEKTESLDPAPFSSSSKWDKYLEEVGFPYEDEDDGNTEMFSYVPPSNNSPSMPSIEAETFIEMSDTSIPINTTQNIAYK